MTQASDDLLIQHQPTEIQPKQIQPSILHYTPMHTDAFIETMRQQIIAFNAPHFEGLIREPLGLACHNDLGQLIGGLAGKTFGNWFLLEYLWVDSQQRGQGIGSKLLQDAEALAKQRHCRFVLLDTLDFQAAPFYQAQGYHQVWSQQEYPLTGQKHFMVKTL